MKNLLVIVFITVFVASCGLYPKNNSNSSIFSTSSSASFSDNLFAYKAIDKSLLISKDNLSKVNSNVYRSLDEMYIDPKTRLKAENWKPKADKIKEYSTDLVNYLESLKLDLKKEADFKIDKDGKEIFKEDDLGIPEKLFCSSGKNRGIELIKKLKEYKVMVLALDPLFIKKFEKNFPLEADELMKGRDGKIVKFEDAYFQNSSTLAGLAILSQFENNVLNAENLLITYCAEQVGAVKVHFDAFGPLVSQSSTIVMMGDELEISAGLGAYSKDILPSIKIGGSQVKLTNGVANWKIVASSIGDQSVPVVVNYLNQDGIPQSVTRIIKYRVIQSSK